MYGEYARFFIEGGYVAIGWFPLEDLSRIRNREEIRDLYSKVYPGDTSPYVIGQQVGQISRFLLEMQPGDYVLTPDSNLELLHWGILEEPSYYYESGNECPFPHRKRVKWTSKVLQRSQFSVPFQNSIRSSLTIFSVNPKNEFYEIIGRHDLVDTQQVRAHESAKEIVLNRVLELSAEDFELLAKTLLETLGFEAQHTGKVGDGGVDAIGELDLYGLARMKLFVQAKRYKRDKKISANTVKALRQSIPSGAQGAFITTADFQEDALKAAIEQGFPRIGTINGEQLVDLLSEKWEMLPDDLRKRLGLKLTLMVE